jgi:hypothetical protein
LLGNKGDGAFSVGISLVQETAITRKLNLEKVTCQKLEVSRSIQDFLGEAQKQSGRRLND